MKKEEIVYFGLIVLIVCSMIGVAIAESHIRFYTEDYTHHNQQINERIAPYLFMRDTWRDVIFYVSVVLFFIVLYDIHRT